MNSLRVLLAITAHTDMNIQTFDVKTAFLYGDLEEEIYTEIPEGYKNTGKICLLKRALYGLRQRPTGYLSRYCSITSQTEEKKIEEKGTQNGQGKQTNKQYRKIKKEK
jgi:hypothetical protein